MSSSPSPSASTIAQTPNSTSVDLPPTRSGRQRKSVAKFGSMIDSDLVGDYVEDAKSGDEDRWEDEGQVDDAEGEESFGKSEKRKKVVMSDEDDDEDGDEGEEEEEEEEDGKKKRSKKSSKGKAKPTKPSKPAPAEYKKGKKPLPLTAKASKTLIQPKNYTKPAVKTSSKFSVEIPKSVPKKRKVVNENEDEEDEEGEGSDVAKKTGGSSKAKEKVLAKSTKSIEKLSASSKRASSAAPSETETLKNEDDEGVEGNIKTGQTSAPSSPTPAKKAKTVPIASKSSTTLDLPKTSSSSKVALAPAKTKPAASSKVQLTKTSSSTAKGRGGGLTLAKKADSAVDVKKTGGKVDIKKSGVAVKDDKKKVEEAKKVDIKKKSVEDKKGKGKKEVEMEVDEEEAEAEISAKVDDEQDVKSDTEAMPDSKAAKAKTPEVVEEEITEDEDAPAKLRDDDEEEPEVAPPVKAKPASATTKAKPTKTAAGSKKVAPKETVKATVSAKNKVTPPAKGRGKKAVVERDGDVEDSVDEQKEAEKDEAEGLSEVGEDAEVEKSGEEDEEPTTPTPKKRSATKPTSRTSSSNSSQPKSSPPEKISSEIRVMILKALTDPTFIKQIDFKSIASTFNNAPDSTKLSRHWREILSKDIIMAMEGSSIKPSTKAAGKGVINKEHRLATWEAVGNVYEKADWKKIEKQAGGINVTKLKRHFREVMVKDGKKCINGN